MLDGIGMPPNRWVKEEGEVLSRIPISLSKEETEDK